MQTLVKPQTISALISDLAAKTAEIKQIEADLKIAKDEASAIEDQILAILDEQGTDLANAKGVGKVKVTESVVPQVESWDDFYRFILRKKWTHLLERRPSVTGCRELWDQDTAIPGVTKFTKRKVKFTPE